MRFGQHIVWSMDLPRKNWAYIDNNSVVLQTTANQSGSAVLLFQVAVCWRYWGLSPCISVFNRTDVCRKAHSSAVNSAKEYVASNQVVGGSNPSGRAIISMSYGALKICPLRYSQHSPIFLRPPRW